MIVGKQEEGSSPAFTKSMALQAYSRVSNVKPFSQLADIGCGRGELSFALSSLGHKILMADSYKPAMLPSNAMFEQIDLNSAWSISDASINFAFALEVIEHVENPRHFIREF